MRQVGAATPKQLVAIVCSAQVLVQIGAFFWPALLSSFMLRWNLNYSEAGWITAAFYGAYILAVPVLVTLTDRLDPKSVYLTGVALTVAGHGFFALFADGFWLAMAARSLSGIGWAGTYMTGLKLLADRVEGKLMSRATAGHAASIGISGAISFAAADLLASTMGWRTAFALAAVSAAFAMFLVALVVPWSEGGPKAKDQGAPALFDFRPVLRNRSAMAYAVVYGIHTLEMNALRGWGVAFLAFVAAQIGTAATVITPAAALTAIGIIGTFASVVGNEAAIRYGRRRLVSVAVIGSAATAFLIGLIEPISYGLAVIMLCVYGALVWLDSSTLTAGAAGTAEPSQRGATLAVHSMLGYSGGFVGPLAVGWILDAAGGGSHGWFAAFAFVAALSVAAAVAFWVMRPRELAGDGSKPG